MNKKLLFVIAIVCLLVFTGCSNKNNNNKYALDFKEEYESLNGKTNKSGKEHRKVSIDTNNPFEKITASELLKKLENKETFYVYFGDKLCPWCRSVIEKAIEVANKNNIDKIYYVAIWDDEGNEILRDKYELKDDEIVKVNEGIEEYQELLKYFKSVLSDYTLNDSDGNKIGVGEKRIYAPNFIYVEDGKAIRITEGISSLQKDSREELTDEILNDEEELFEEFFK